MKTCEMKDADLLDFFDDDLSEERRKSMAEHFDRCSDCRGNIEELRKVLDGTDSVREEIRRTLGTVDWDTLPARITDYVFERGDRTDPAKQGRGFKVWLGRLQLKPIAAGVLLGLMIGSFAMYLALRKPSPEAAGGAGFFASREVLDKIELEMARRETLDYLQKSQYVLLDFVQAPSGESWNRSAFDSERAKALLSKKKYLNSQLDKYKMAKAKAICDQIEMLFLELAQISEDLPQAELEKIQNLIRERQLLLKINLVRKELEEREV